MKRLIFIIVSALLLISGCSKTEKMGASPFDLVLESGEINEIRIQDKLTSGDFSTIDLEEDIQYFCEGFNSIDFQFSKSYADLEDKPAGEMFRIHISCKDGSSFSIGVPGENSIQIGETVYRASGSKLMSLMKYEYQYAEDRTIYEFADSIDKKLSEYEHFMGVEADKDENIIIVYTSSMESSVIDEYRKNIGETDISIIYQTAEDQGD